MIIVHIRTIMLGNSSTSIVNLPQILLHMVYLPYPTIIANPQKYFSSTTVQYARASKEIIYTFFHVYDSPNLIEVHKEKQALKQL